MSGRSIDVNYYGLQQSNLSTSAFFAPQCSTFIGRRAGPLASAECGCGARDWGYDAQDRMRCGYCRCQPREAAR